MADPRRTYAILFDNLGPYHMGRLAGALGYGEVLAIEGSPQRSEYAWVKPTLPVGVGYAPFELRAAAASDPQRIEGELERSFGGGLPAALAVPGWSSLAALVATRWAVRHDIPVIGMSETNAQDEPRRRSIEAIKRGVVAHFAGGLTGSRSQAAYLAELGVPADAIAVGYDVVDNRYFADRAAAARAAGVMPEVGGERLPEAMRERYFLASARFVEKKNLPGLIRAYAAFRAGRSEDPSDWPLVVLGDGEERPRIEAAIAAGGVAGHVRLAGFRQVEELAGFYATAGALVHASTTEQWGLVVNEAMASGLPVVVSRRCGCVEELVEDNVTGLIFDPFDEAAITAALHLAAELPDRAALIARALERIAAWDLDRFGRSLHHAATQALAHPLPRPSLTAWMGMELAIRQRQRELRVALATPSIQESVAR